ncbi:unnamed protein product [Adineta ricciae]|uniref:CENP-V/GFA domain-containing protein n=1 Tax=Adineta ricciae TaxID=249248 RepID=A0A814IRR0_ADIRI|nr:unnamed protein product [Adineta ricciae]CAF1199577.1 unnamed protein product [Adineta ricciae]
MNTRTALYTGGCQCGAIRYSISAPSVQSLTVCHCRMYFQWTRGSIASFESSSLARRIFCAQCGTPLAYQSKEKPLIDVCLGTFDQPKQFGKPKMQIGVESCLGEWALVQDAIKMTTDQLISDAIVSYQHPDKDTDDIRWQHM